MNPVPFAIAALALAVAMAGCASTPPADEPTGPYPSYDAAAAAPGRTQSDGDLDVKLVEPRGTEAGSGAQRLVLVLSRDGGPVEGATIQLESMMPSMGHGSHADEDPTHTAHSVYVGSTDFNMPGEWELRFEVSLPGDAGTRAVVFPFTVQ